MDLTQMSYMTLRRHALVERCGIPELVQAVRDGKVTVCCRRGTHLPVTGRAARAVERASPFR